MLQTFLCISWVIQLKFEANQSMGSRVMIGQPNKQTDRKEEITTLYTGLPRKIETVKTAWNSSNMTILMLSLKGL